MKSLLHRFRYGLLLILVSLHAIEVQAADTVPPIRALLITGGCCHDYAAQKDILKTGIEARAHVVVHQIHSDDKSTAPPLAIFGNADYAKNYDIVIHDECAAKIDDPAIIAKVLAPHRKGMPGVNLHCAMHSYRIGDPKEKAMPGSERSMWFEYLGVQSSGHGPKLPLSIAAADKKHPVMTDLGWENWTTGNEELYNNVQLLGTAVPLQNSTQFVKNKDGSDRTDSAIVTWTNDYGGTRVFSTSIGHDNVTVADDRYLDLVTRGILWACDKLNPTYLKP